VELERGPLSLVTIIEELFEGNSGFGPYYDSFDLNGSSCVPLHREVYQTHLNVFSS
jgi:hypothetical protein